MKRVAALLLVYALMLAPVLAALPAPGEPGAPNDPRYCGEPKRTAKGVIVRSQAQLKAFASVFPCPASLQPSPSCEGWDIDHVIPLVDGGCDKPINMHWLPNAIKSCASPACKDRWERLYHALPRKAVSLKGTSP